MRNKFQKQKLYANLGQSALIVIVTAVLLELSAMGYFKFFHKKSNWRRNGVDPEHKFWKYDRELGWSGKPNAKGTFSGKEFSGAVTFNGAGFRQNAENDTFRRGYQNVLFIGDSTSASLEVDDHETVPALIESRVREAGKNLNILNLGVRGYGTDQSIRRALWAIPKYKPVSIIYLFTNNDLRNIQTLKRRGRKYGKGVYTRNTSTKRFLAHNYPVPKYPHGYGEVFTLDDRCQPRLVKIRRPPRFRSNFFKLWWKAIGWRLPTKGNLTNRQWNQVVLKDAKRCPSYFSDYLSHLFGLAFQQSNKIDFYVFSDPRGESETNLKILKESIAPFKQMKLTDLHSKLRRDGHKTSEFSCPGDPKHYCEEGNQWTAKAIYEVVFSDLGNE